MATNPARDLTVAQMLPPDWAGIEAVWLAIYRVIGLPKQDIETAVMETMGDVRIVFLWGRLPFVTRRETGVRPDGTPEIQFHVEEGKTAGPWTLLLTPTNVLDDPDDEGPTRGRIEAAVGIIIVLGSRNLAFERVSDTAVHVNGKTTSFGEPFENPGFFPKPDVTPPTISLFRAAAERLNASPEAARARIELSLGWIEQSQRGLNTADGFVKAWIALEALAMPDWRNIKPIKAALAEAYGVSTEEAGRRFAVGRLFGLRSEILHAGRTNVDARLVAYAACIYQDLFRRELGLPFVGRAGQWLNENGPVQGLF